MFSINPTESLAMAYWATGNLLQNQLFIGGRGGGGGGPWFPFPPCQAVKQAELLKFKIPQAEVVSRGQGTVSVHQTPLHTPGHVLTCQLDKQGGQCLPEAF